MTTPAFDRYDRGIYEVPVPPHEFGQDGGKFYRCYDALADEIDDDMVKGLKEQLDGLLIFVSPSPITAQYSWSTCSCVVGRSLRRSQFRFSRAHPSSHEPRPRRRH